MHTYHEVFPIVPKSPQYPAPHGSAHCFRSQNVTPTSSGQNGPRHEAFVSLPCFGPERRLPSPFPLPIQYQKMILKQSAQPPQITGQLVSRLLLPCHKTRQCASSASAYLPPSPESEQTLKEKIRGDNYIIFIVAPPKITPPV